MGAFFVYIVKSAVCLAFFFLFYRLLLSRETFHRFNRIALLGILILSCAIPFVEVTMKEPMEVSQQLLTWEELLLMANLNRTATIETAPESVITWREALLMVYLLGIVFFFLRNVWSLTRMLRLIKGSTLVRQENGITLITHQKEIAPFSWMKFVVISEKDLKENGEEILTHEYAHIRKKHSIDLLIADVCIFFQWFNPASWLLKQELQNIHEFEADESVIAQGIDAKKYQLLLIKKAVGTRLYSMACGFDHCSLKKRITMMMERKTPGWKHLYILIAFPLAAGAVFVFAQPKVDAALQTVVVRQAAMCDSSSLNMSVSAADYAGLAPDAVAFDVYVNQRNQLMIGVFDKMDVVKLEGLADAVSKRLVADFSSRYAKNKEAPQIVACITADRNAKMGCVYETKQQISRGYELALRELSAEYSAELLQHSLSNWIVYNPPRSYGNPVAKVADKNKRLEGFGITIFMEGEEKRSLRDFTLQELESEIASLLERVDISKNVISIGLNVPKDVQEGMVYDVKQVLRKLYLLKVDVAH